MSEKASRKDKRPAARRPASNSVARRYIRRLLLTVLVLIPLSAGLLIWLAFFTDVCAIENITITGNKSLTTDEVRQLSGIAAYKNLITLPVKRLAANLERNLWIRDVKVGRHLLHTVNMVVEERSPLAMLDYSGACFLVDERGFIFTGTTADQLPELLRIYCGDLAAPKIGETVKDKKISESVKIVASMPQALRASLSLANPFDGRGVVFASKGGFAIVYGSAEETARKNEVLQAVLLDIANNGRRIAYVDVKVPDAPVIKPK